MCRTSYAKSPLPFTQENSMKRGNFIQYDRSKKDYATHNRRNMTPAEKLMREKVLRKKQTWYTFLRQKLLWPFIADFYCSKLLLVVEIDGDSHDDKQAYDANRTDVINDLWIVVVRYTNEDVFKNIQEVKEDLCVQMEKRKKHLEEVSC